jgi:enoyl-CoA hydratase
MLTRTIHLAGADVREISQLDANQARRVRYLEDLSHGLSRIRKPVIAAIESTAVSPYR